MTLGRCDVAIVGGGPAGSALAIALARCGLRVSLVEPVAERRFRVGETVPPDLRWYLDTLGVWASFAQGAHPPSGGICSAWGEPTLSFQDAFSHPRGAGWHLDRSRFDATLLVEAGRSGVEILTGSRVVGIERQAGKSRTGEMSADQTVVVRSGDRRTHRLMARFVVDATGRSASIARRFGSRRLRSDRLVAMCARFTLPDRAAVSDYTVVEAAECGWWYATRLPDDGAIVAFFTDDDLLRRYALSRPDRWYQFLCRTRHVHESLGRPSEPRALAGTSAATHCLLPIVGDGWLAVGDAATAWDPLASAGIVHALRSGIEAATVIAGQLNGERGVLPDFERQIQRRFTRYLLELRAYYALETRWPRSTFWQRRHAAATLLPAVGDGTRLPRPTSPRIARTLSPLTPSSIRLE